MKNYDARINGDLFHAALFAGRTFGNYALDVSAGYARGWNDAYRNVVFPGYWTFGNRASFYQDIWTIRSQIGKVWQLRNRTRLVSGIALDYAGVHGSSFEESGDYTALRLESSTYHSLELPISLTLDKTYCVYGTKWTPYISGAWTPELLGGHSSTTASFVTRDVIGAFETRTLRSIGSYGSMVAGFKREHHATTVEVDYAFDFARNYEEHNMALSLRKCF